MKKKKIKNISHSLYDNPFWQLTTRFWLITQHSKWSAFKLCFRFSIALRFLPDHCNYIAMSRCSIQVDVFFFSSLNKWQQIRYKLINVQCSMFKCSQFVQLYQQNENFVDRNKNRYAMNHFNSPKTHKQNILIESFRSKSILKQVSHNSDKSWELHTLCITYNICKCV